MVLGKIGRTHTKADVGISGISGNVGIFRCPENFETYGKMVVWVDKLDEQGRKRVKTQVNMKNKTLE